MTDKPENSEEWEQAKEQLDEKDLLMRIAFGVDELNRQMQALRQAQTTDTAEQVETHTCDGCGDEIPANKLESHARSCLNWTEAFGDVEEMYS
jgi:RNA polymerase-binding transcription factor DksA